VSRSGFKSLAAHHAGVTGILAYLASSNLAACAFESHLPHPMAIRGIWQTRRALTPEFPGSRPGWPATPPRTACGPAPVRREARFDTGWRLHVLVDQMSRSHDPEEIGSARSNRAGDTLPL
jgi:hypothetical protein